MLCRQMEVYAGFLEYTDHHVGRLVDGLQRLRCASTTRWCVLAIIDDNSAEGHDQRYLQRDVGTSQRPDQHRLPHDRPARQVRRAESYTTIRWVTCDGYPPNSGPNAASALGWHGVTARLCTGPTELSPRGRC